MRLSFLLFFLLAAFGPAPALAGGASDSLTQVSVISALMAGDYDGSVGLDKLKTLGDFGLGTFDGLDGEMVVLEGVVYQVRSDGSVAQPGDGERTPFAAVVRFSADRRLQLAAAGSLEQLNQALDALIGSANRFYAVRIDGPLPRLKVRSVPRQAKPYPSLAEAAKAQTVFDLDGARGTLVGLRCPAYSKGMAVPGYHWHFISEDRKRGGHVLDLALGKATAFVDDLSGFSVILPQGAAFGALDLSGDVSAALKRVETAPEK